ncbi:aspartate dehydrogenase [Acetobacter sp.]|jgi:aspartate dehydrogenase|uniref:aspartate dehydrogenase n=1 Tax=Acetobacter sp. TaxID=440 RepID=UPI0025BC3AF5|nr:aspartate dehydrogenase [Acetobacter sp.]MCH4092052.1 aspartate dehydrogenase [Acetobacter sp.]MCI1300694.1 aspartate dehydrogenase [Acetobacter sp.]MCI1317628.1 aspartate dehydrogenase [Acetobacter sp.]
MKKEGLHLGLIGSGSMSATVVAALTDAGVRIERLSVLVRPGREASGQTAITEWKTGDAASRVVSTLEELIASEPDIVGECASQQAVASCVPLLLAAGIETVIASVGALADRDIFASLSQTNPGKLHIATGAVSGMDGLSAARLSGLTEVIYTGRKPPSSWPAGGTDYAIVFKGSAREAALQFPKNANVAATVALAGLGFDHTQVLLIADPECASNVHEISFVSGCARGSFRMEGVPSPDNPKTSLTAGYSVANVILNAIRPALQTAARDVV